MGDDDLVYKDADGSLSSYYNLFLTGTCPNGGQGYLLTDPTWTTFSGGPVNGQALTNANILAIEDGFIYTLGAVGDNNYHYYLYSTGTYVAMSNPGFPTFTGGPLNGTTPRTAMTNTVPGITFLGGGALELVFFDANTNATVTYNRNNLFLTWAGINATSLSDPLPADAFVYDHTSINDVLGPDFLGVGDVELLLLDATGHMEWYNFLTINGPGVYEVDMSILRGPQGGAMINNPNYLDATDNGFSFIDADGTISWYNNATNTVWHDANWQTFTGGPLNGVAPSKSNIVATEDAGVYVLDTDGSLFYYNICDGKPFAVPDLNSPTVLTGGPLNGKDLSDAVTNMVPGVVFLGMSGDEMVFGLCLKPEVETTKRVIAVVPNSPANTSPGHTSTHNVTYEVKISNAGPVQIDRLQIKDSIAAQLGCAFVRVVPGTSINAQWGLTTPLTPLATLNPNFNGTSDINILSTTNTTAGLPTNWLYNTVSVWYTVEIDADCNGTCSPNPSSPFLLNQARGTATRLGGTESDSDLSDDGFYDAADFFPVAPQPPTPPLPGQVPFIENVLWPGQTLPSPYGDADRDNPTPLIFPGLTTTKGLVGSMVDPADPNFALAEFEIMLTNTGTSDLTMVTLTDNLLANLGCALVNIATPPAIVAGSTTAMTNPTINGGFNGSTSINIFNGTTGLLKPCQEVTVRFTVRINPNCGATLGNTATGGATGDQFDAGPGAGSGPLAGGNLTTVPAGGPKTITAPSVPAAGSPVGPGGALVINVTLINTVKRVVSVVPAPCPPTATAAGTVNVTFEIGIKNTGNVNLTNLQITDAIAAQMGCSFVNMVGTLTIVSSTATTAPTVNAAFGAASTTLFNGTTGVLASNQQIFVQFTVAMNPNCQATVPTNQANGAGTGAGPVGTPVVVTDLSDSGNAFESNNAGQPGDTGGQNDPTPINAPNICVSKGVVNVVNAPHPAAGGNVVATFEFTVKNTGNVPLSALTLADAFAAQMGCTFVSISAAPAITASTGATGIATNAGWTGTGNIITAGNLAVNGSVTIVFSAIMDPNCQAAIPTNTAIATASGTGPAGTAVTVTDNSDSGYDAESNNTGAPGDSGCEDDPTPIYMPALSSYKNVVSFQRAASCTPGNVDATFEICLKNVGNVSLNNLSMVDNIAAQLGAAFVGITTAPAIFTSSATTTPAVNNFPNIFAGTSGLLAVGQAICVQAVVEMNPNATVMQFNQASVAGQGIRADNGQPVLKKDGTPIIATDLTDGGETHESFNIGYPGDLGTEEDPLKILIPQLDLSKRVVECVKEPLQMPISGHAWVTFEMILKNTGNVNLTNLQIADAMGAQLGGATLLGIVTAPAISASTATANPVLNSNFNGAGNSNIFNGTTGNLAQNQTITLRFKILMDPDAVGAIIPAYNQATATGSGTNHKGVVVTVSDLSDHGVVPENFNAQYENNNTGNCAVDDPTPVDVPMVLTTKELSGYQCFDADGCTGEVYATFRYRLENAGNVNLVNTNFSDDLVAQMGNGFIKAFGGYTGFKHIDGGFTASFNENYDGGVTDAEMFNVPNSTFLMDEYGVFEQVVVLAANHPAVAFPLTNQAMATANGVRWNGHFVTEPDLATLKIAMDMTDSGNDPFTTNPGADGDTGGSNDPTDLDILHFETHPQNIVMDACNSQEDFKNWLDNMGGAVFAAGQTVVNYQTEVIDETDWVCKGKTAERTKTIRFEFMDENGNTVCWCATVTERDSDAPNWDMSAMDKTVDCNDPMANASVQMWLDSDGMGWVFDCSEEMEVTNNFAGNLACGSIKVIFTATDICGNKSTSEATLTVTDAVAPVLAGVPADMTLNCGAATPAAATVSATDACTPNVAVKFSEINANWKGTLAGSNENPANASTAKGRVFAKLNGSNLEIVVSFSGLTANATAAHIHEAPAGTNGPVRVDFVSLGFPVGQKSGIFSTTVALTPALQTALAAGNLYVNIHNATFPGGEIRAQITAACQPAIARIWSATDACGNKTAAMQAIIFEDKIAPVIANVPVNQTIVCPAVPVFGTPTATDNCSTATMTFNDVTTGACPNAHTVTRTWTATDACGNTVTAWTIITVQAANVASVLTMNCSSNINQQAATGATGATVIFGTPTTSTTCTTGTISVVQTAGPTSGSTFPIGTTQVCFRATDGCGNEKTCCFSVTVTQQNPPTSILTLTPPPNKTGDCTNPVDFDQPTRSTTCPGGVVNLTFVDNSTGNSCSGLTKTRTWTATDACGNAKTASQTITVAPDKTAPVFTSLPPQDMMFSCDDVVNIGTATATDNCSSVTVTSTVTNNGTDKCNTINGITYGYDLLVKWTATDACGNSVSETRNIWVLSSGTSFFNKPVDKTMHCGEAIVWNQPMAKSVHGPIVSIDFQDFANLDACGAGTITRRWTATDDKGNTCLAEQIMTLMPDTQQPEFLNFTQNLNVSTCAAQIPVVAPTVSDNCADVAQITLTFSDLKNGNTILRTWKAEDACGNVNEVVQNIQILDDQKPQFTTVLVDKILPCGSPILFDAAVATDDCSTVALTFEDSHEFLNCMVKHTRVWTATDDTGNISKTQQNISVGADFEIPAIVLDNPTTTLTCENLASAETPKISDNCSSGSNLKLEMVENQSGSIITRTWTVTDFCGNANVITQIITVTDNAAPVFDHFPTDKLITCEMPFAFDNLMATDNCGDASVEISDNVAINSDCETSITRIWTASDAFGNKQVVAQNVTQRDDLAPVFDQILGNLEMTFAAFATWQPLAVTATDNCQATTVSNSFEAIDNCNFKILYTANDGCGNETAMQQHIKLTDGICSPSGVNELNGVAFKVYPNPAQSILTVDGTAALPNDTRFEIVDVLGRILLEGKIVNLKTSIDVVNLASGNYLLRLYFGKSNVTVNFVKIEE